MRQRIVTLAVIMCLTIPAWGCVAKNKYLKKEGEAKTLADNLQSLQQKYDDLVKEKNGLQQMYDGLVKENQGLQKDIAGKQKTIAEQQAQKRALEREKEQQAKKMSGTYEALLAKMKDEISKGEVTISELKGKLTVNMVNSILFDSGKAEVKSEGLEVLNKVVGVLKEVSDKAIKIEGHTDNVQISGGLASIYPTNWELSAARAINVTKHLQEKGIDPSFLTAEAHSEYSPVADNNSEEGKAMNRRIEIILVARK